MRKQVYRLNKTFLSAIVLEMTFRLKLHLYKGGITIKKRALNVNIFILLTIICPIIDLINGFFITSGSSALVGIIYRSGYLAFLVLMILFGRASKSIFSVLTFVFIFGNLILFLLQGLILQNETSWFIADISVYMKYFFWILIPYYIYQQKENFKYLQFEHIFIFLGLLLTSGLLIPYFLGTGNQTYVTAGYKGFFFEQNSISFSLIITLTFTAHTLSNVLQKKWGGKAFFLLILFFGNIFSLFLLATKTGIFYAVAVIVYMIIKLLFVNQYSSSSQKVIVWVGAMAISIWFFIRGFKYVGELVKGTYERVQYFYKFYNGDLLSLISSSRNAFLEGASNFFFNDPNIAFTFFGGQGFEYRLQNFGRLGLVEMDFFDLFFGVGIIGTCLFIFMGLYFLVQSFKQGKLTIYSFALILSLIYIFAVGHVLFSALAAMMLGLICAGCILSNEQNKNKYEGNNEVVAT